MRERSSIAFGILLMLASGPLAVAGDVSIPAAPAGCSTGYRVYSVTLDPVLHRRWAWMEDCSHPERPLKVIALSTGQETSSAARIESAIAETARLPQPSPVRTPQFFSINAAPMPIVSAGPLKRIHPVAVASATHLASPAHSQIAPSPPEIPLVRAGERVHLWSSEANVRLEIEVIALEYGHAGQVVHFRRKDQPTELSGVVTGRDIAELMP